MRNLCLSSTSLTTDASGQVVSELRYTAWGEVRYQSGDTPTRYQYTGQYSYSGEFGLLFYNARWYDGSLGRFAQADTIIPPTQGVQGWDRYAYTNNNPLRYTDPTGHAVDVDDGGSYTPVSNSDYCETHPGACGGDNDDNNNGERQPCTNCHSESVPYAEFSYTNYNSTQDWYVAGYDYQINWSQVDWYHLMTNGSGIAGDVALGLTVVGVLPAAPVAEFTQIIDVIGVATDVIDFVSEGDFSGISLDIAQSVFKETKAVRIIPVVGFSSNIKAFFEALYRGSTKMPIWKRKPDTGAQP